MTRQEYEEERSKIDSAHRDATEALNRIFAFKNSPLKVGDIATDHIGSVRVDKIRYSKSQFGIPVCLYYGQVLKKDLTPTKKIQVRGVWQVNLKGGQCENARDN